MHMGNHEYLLEDISRRAPRNLSFIIMKHIEQIPILKLHVLGSFLGLFCVNSTGGADGGAQGICCKNTGGRLFMAGLLAGEILVGWVGADLWAGHNKQFSCPAHKSGPPTPQTFIQPTNLPCQGELPNLCQSIYCSPPCAPKFWDPIEQTIQAFLL